MPTSGSRSVAYSSSLRDVSSDASGDGVGASASWMATEGSSCAISSGTDTIVVLRDGAVPLGSVEFSSIVCDTCGTRGAKKVI